MVKHLFNLALNNYTTYLCSYRHTAEKDFAAHCYGYQVLTENDFTHYTNDDYGEAMNKAKSYNFNDKAMQTE